MPKKIARLQPRGAIAGAWVDIFGPLEKLRLHKYVIFSQTPRRVIGGDPRVFGQVSKLPQVPAKDARPSPENSPLAPRIRQTACLRARLGNPLESRIMLTEPRPRGSGCGLFQRSLTPENGPLAPRIRQTAC